MGFEAPLALLALALAGLPIVAHLLRRRDLPRRRLPTIALLRRAEASSRKNVRLVDLLLLIVRALIVVVAVLALARPFLSITLAYGDGSVASVVVVVDDSMSMAGRGDPSLLARATQRASDVLESLPAGSEVAVVLAGAPARVLTSRTVDHGAAVRALSRVDEGSARGTDLAGAMELAERELAGARHAERRIVVLSDLAAHARAHDLVLPRGVSVRFEPLGEGAATRNAAVIGARAAADPTTPGLSSIAVEVLGAPELDGEAVLLVLRRGGEELARERIELSGGHARATLHASASPDDPGATVSIEIDDALPTDDTRGVLLRPPAGAHVVVVEGARRPGAQGRFLDRAIDLAPERGGALRRHSVDPDTFAAMDLSDVDVVVLANAPAPSRRTATLLREHVERGGGLLVAPGEHFDARQYEARLGELLPARPRGATSAEVEGPLGGADRTVFDGQGLERTHTRRRITFERVDPTATAALVMADGTPALLLANRGDGRVAMLATTLDAEWTDLPFRPGYLPMLVALLRHLAPGASTPDTALSPGEVVHVRPPAGAVRTVVISPDGTEHELDAPSGSAATAGVLFPHTDRPGVYRVRVATRDRGLAELPRMAFLIAPPPEESQLAPGDTPEGSAPRDAAPRGSVVERPFAEWLFLLVGLLAVLEALLRLKVPARLGRARA